MALPVLVAAYWLGGQDWALESFMLIFLIFLSQDFVYFSLEMMGPLLVAHHAACILGLAVAPRARKSGPRGRAYATRR